MAICMEVLGMRVKATLLLLLHGSMQLSVKATLTPFVGEDAVFSLP